MRFDSSGLVSEITERVSANREGLRSEHNLEGLSEEARRLTAKLDDYRVERSLQVVRKASKLPRWEDAVPCRVGSRMGRPEKSGIREMSPRVHAIFPIGESGGPQRLVSEASSRGVIRVDVGPRVCHSCGRQTPHLTCHHRPDPKNPVACGGRTSSSPRKRRGRRKGERTAIELAPILEVKRSS